MEEPVKESALMTHIQELVAEEHRLLDKGTDAHQRPPDVVEKYEG